LTLNYTNKIYPDAEQVAKLLESLKICCGASRYPLQKIKGLINSRQYHVGYCCVKSEYILIVKAALSGYHRQRKELFQAKQRLVKLAEVSYKVG
jgi:putative transposase